MATRRYFDGAQIELGLLPNEIYSAQTELDTISESFTGTNGAAWDSSTWPVQNNTTILSNAGKVTPVNGATRATMSYTFSEGEHEARLDVTFVHGTTVTPQFWVGFGTTSSLYTIVGMPGSGYAIQILQSGSVALNRIDTTASNTSIGSTSLGSLSDGDVIHIRFRISGGQQFVRVWLNGASEPGSWDITTSDANYPSTTYFGIGGYSDGGNSDYWLVDDLSIQSLNVPWLVQFGYIRGHLSSTDSQDAYIEGSTAVTPITDSNNAYIRGSESITDSNSAYIRGHSSASDLQDAYIRGFSSSTDNNDAYIRGYSSTTSSENLYVRGSASATSNNPAYIRGSVATTDAQDLYVRGSESVTDSNNAFIYGYDNTTSNKDVYIRGLNSVTSNKSAYIHGVDSILDAIDLYTRGHASATTDVVAYIRGLLSTTSSNDLYIRGSTATTDANDAYMRGHVGATSSVNLYAVGVSGSTPIDSYLDAYSHGYGSIDSSVGLYMRGIPSTPIALGSKWAYIMSWSDRIYATQNLYVGAPENFASSMKRAHITGVPTYSAGASTYLYMSGDEITTTLFDMMIGTDFGGQTHTSWDALVLLDGDGTGQFIHGEVVYPISETLYTVFSIPTETIPMDMQVTQDAWITTYTESTSSQSCFVNAGFIGGFEQGYKRCMVIVETPDIDSGIECYIVGDLFFVSNVSAYVVGGDAPYRTSQKYLYLNAERDYVELTIDGFISGHNYASSTKRCYLPTVNFSQNRKQAYIEGS